MDAQEFLKIVKSKDNIKNYKIAAVDSNYTTGRPRLIFDGETVTTVKQYPYLSSYTPNANDRVLLAYIANSYVILGKII